MQLSLAVCLAINKRYGRYVKVRVREIEDFIEQVNQNVDHRYYGDVYDTGDIRELTEMYYESIIAPKMSGGMPQLTEEELDVLFEGFDSLAEVWKILVDVKNKVCDVASKSAWDALNEAEKQVVKAMTSIDAQMPDPDDDEEVE